MSSIKNSGTAAGGKGSQNACFPEREKEARQKVMNEKKRLSIQERIPGRRQKAGDQTNLYICEEDK